MTGRAGGPRRGGAPLQMDARLAGFLQQRRGPATPSPHGVQNMRPQLQQHYVGIRDALNLSEREISLADHAARKAVFDPTVSWDEKTVSRCPSVFADSYNATLLLSLLTFLTYGRILYKGPPGFGKTTTAELWGHSIYGIPMDILQAATIYGNDKVTEEMVLARFDIGKLAKEGVEEVHERLFALLPFRIIDELNRIPPHILSLLYQLVDRSLHVYGNEHLEIPPGALFATINERVGVADVQRSGNFAIPRPFYDRFDVSLIVSGLNPFMFHTLLSNALLVGARRTGQDAEKTTKRRVTTQEIAGLERMWEAKKTLEAVQAEIEQVAFPHDLTAQIEFFLAQIYYCERLADGMMAEFWASKANRQKTSLKQMCAEAPGCKDQKRICSLTDTYQASIRAQLSLIKYARAFAWYRADETARSSSILVNPLEVQELLPFILGHRIYSEEDESSEGVRHRAIRQMWENAQRERQRDDVRGIVEEYYKTKGVLRQEINERGGHFRLDTPRDRKNELAGLMNRIRSMPNVARIPMIINMMRLIGDYGVPG